MKAVTLAAFNMVLGLALSTSAFSQRHDEKPHGMKKPAVKKDATKAVDDKGSK